MAKPLRHSVLLSSPAWACSTGKTVASYTPIPVPDVSVSEPLSLVTLRSQCLQVVQRAHPCGPPAHAHVSCPTSPQTARVSTSRWARPPWAGLRVGVPGEISEPVVERTPASPCVRGLGKPWGCPCRPCRCAQLLHRLQLAQPQGPSARARLQGAQETRPQPRAALRCWETLWRDRGTDRSCCISVAFGFLFPRAPC